MIYGLVRACLLFNIVGDAEAVRICDGCPGSFVKVSPLLLRRVLAAADGLTRPLEAINVGNTV